MPTPLNPCGSYSATCSRDFPIQGDVVPKVWIGSKTFMSKTTEGAHCSHTLGRKSILFVIKVLEFLKPFSKGFKWVWAKPTTLTPRPVVARERNFSKMIDFFCVLCYTVLQYFQGSIIIWWLAVCRITCSVACHSWHASVIKTDLSVLAAVNTFNLYMVQLH